MTHSVSWLSLALLLRQLRLTPVELLLVCAVGMLCCAAAPTHVTLYRDMRTTNNMDGTKTTCFGYKITQNDNIPVSTAHNTIIPAPMDRGQPVTFTSGRKYCVFTVTFTEKFIEWQVKGGDNQLAIVSSWVTPTATPTPTPTHTFTASVRITPATRTTALTRSTTISLQPSRTQSLVHTRTLTLFTDRIQDWQRHGHKYAQRRIVEKYDALCFSHQEPYAKCAPYANAERRRDKDNNS